MHNPHPEWRAPEGYPAPKPVPLVKEPEELLRLFGRIELEAPLILAKLVSAFEALRDPDKKEPRLNARINLLQGFFRELLDPALLKDLINLDDRTRDRALDFVASRLNTTRNMLSTLRIEKDDNLQIYSLLTALRAACTAAATPRSGGRTDLSVEEWRGKVTNALSGLLSVIDAQSTEPVSALRKK